MRLTIVRPDNVVLVDGKGLNMDLSRFRSLRDVRVVQWDGEKGHLEFNGRPNEPIESMVPYQEVVDAFKLKLKEKEDAERDAKASKDHGGSGPQPSVRKEDGHPPVGGKGV